MFVLLIGLDSIDLLLKSLECLLPPLPLSHLRECLLPLFIPLQPPLLSLLPSAVAHQQVVHDVLRVRVHVVFLRHHLICVLLIQITRVLHFRVLDTRVLTTFLSVNILISFD